uniref:Uncharacterized protein n=1 Tax=Plectus sambesii TaxID=2011161 RepID=A0A914WIC3_9BILA
MKKTTVEKNSSQDSNESNDKNEKDVAFLKFVRDQFLQPGGIYHAAFERSVLLQQYNEEEALKKNRAKIEKENVMARLLSEDIGFLEFSSVLLLHPFRYFEVVAGRNELRRQRNKEKALRAKRAKLEKAKEKDWLESRDAVVDLPIPKSGVDREAEEQFAPHTINEKSFDALESAANLVTAALLAMPTSSAATTHDTKRSEALLEQLTEDLQLMKEALLERTIYKVPFIT